MFTGIVTAVGQMVAMNPREGGLRLRIDASGLPGEPLELGESIAVQGVCLTVADILDGRIFEADVSGETLRLTTLGRLSAGAGINLERALRAGDRLGGHLVSGHVDGVGALRSTAPDGLSSVHHFRWRTG